VSLKDRINEDLKAAMRAGDALRRDTLRLLLAAVKQREVDGRQALAEAETLAVVERLTKQRREAISQFEKGGREDLAQKERAELEILLAYLPQALSGAELEAAVAAAISGTGAKAPSDMGKVMGVLKGELAGRADWGQVSALVKAKLSGR
jgi:uncharacterized protein